MNHTDEFPAEKVFANKTILNETLMQQIKLIILLIYKVTGRDKSLIVA